MFMRVFKPLIANGAALPSNLGFTEAALILYSNGTYTWDLTYTGGEQPLADRGRYTEGENGEVVLTDADGTVFCSGVIVDDPHTPRDRSMAMRSIISLSGHGNTIIGVLVTL